MSWSQSTGANTASKLPPEFYKPETYLGLYVAHIELKKTLEKQTLLLSGVRDELEGWRLLFEREHTLRMAQVKQGKHESFIIGLMAGGGGLVLGIVSGLILGIIIAK